MGEVEDEAKWRGGGAESWEMRGDRRGGGAGTGAGRCESRGR